MKHYNQKYIWIPRHSLKLIDCWFLKLTPNEEKNINIAHYQYHDWGWSGDAKSQGISNHDIDLVILEYSCFSTRMVQYGWANQDLHIDFQ